MTLSETLREAMQESGLSPDALAKVSGVEESTLQRFLAGDADIPLSAGERLASRLALVLLREIVWDEHVEENWPIYAEEAWNAYLSGEGEDTWREELEFGDWNTRQRKAWEKEMRETWASEEKKTWEANELERLAGQRWTRVSDRVARPPAWRHCPGE